MTDLHPLPSAPAVRKPRPGARKLYIQTHGCQMNEYDSARMADVLHADEGMELTPNAEEADVILINTCSIRDNAEQRVRKRLAEFKSQKKNNPKNSQKTQTTFLVAQRNFAAVFGIDIIGNRLLFKGKSRFLLCHVFQ